MENLERDEVWLSVCGYDGLYEVSNHGRVRRVGSKKEQLVQVLDKRGYYHVTLSKENDRSSKRVHRLVLNAFCGPRPFDGAVAAHNNGVSSDNRLTNLRWASPKENQADRVRHGTSCRGEDVFGAKLREGQVREIRKMIASGLRNKPIAEEFGVSLSTVHLIRHNRTWRHVV